MIAIDIEKELDKHGLTYKKGEKTYTLNCPVHRDKTPSAVIYSDSGRWRCYSCKAEGSFAHFLAHATGQEVKDVNQYFSDEYGISNQPVINGELIEKYHAEIYENKELVAALYKRQVTDDLIRKYRIGSHKGRITIPIKDKEGRYIMVKSYLPSGVKQKKEKKMFLLHGRSVNVLYPYAQLRYDNIIIGGGEIKAIVTADKMNNLGFGCVSNIFGEGSWSKSFSDCFDGKNVYICYDIDEPGKNSAKDLAVKLASNLRIKQLKIIDLPLDEAKYPDGDLNDFFIDGTAEELKFTIESALEFKDTFDKEKKSKRFSVVSLPQINTSKYAATPVKTKGNVIAVADGNFLLPKKVKVNCNKDNGQSCEKCVVFVKDKGHEFLIEKDDPHLIDMAGSSKLITESAIKDSIGVYPNCKKCKIETNEFYPTYDIRISPMLSISNINNDRAVVKALYVGEDIELNESYVFTGSCLPLPKTQESVFLIEQADPTTDALSAFNPSQADLEELKIFKAGDQIDAKLKEIYKDLSLNVTKIYDRQDLHFAIDLAYHSPLTFKIFDDIIKGWVEILIIGDSSQGKTEASSRLQEFYQLGERTVCKNASVAGLIGGAEQINGKWFISWGILPTQDKTLVILEELKGTPTEVIAKLTDARSSGVAEIPKIARRKSHSRTRIIAISNPRSENQMSTFNYGVDAVAQLIGAPEDIRRFDLALAVSLEDIDPNIIAKYQAKPPTLPHRFTSELCRRLILWAWTRKPNQIHFESIEYLVQKSVELTEIYDESIPLVDKGSIRFKIARLAAALAARLFSTNDYQNLVVTNSHIDYIVSFLNKIYSHDNFGYRQYSKQVKAAKSIKDPEQVSKTIRRLEYYDVFIEQMLSLDMIKLVDIQDTTGKDRQDAIELVSTLRRNNCLRNTKNGYQKTPMFTKLLKELKKYQREDVPDFSKKKNF